ncbi:MAG: hypothetical protein ACKV22_25040 [Bryobacteraceae bacterium]
MVFLLALALVFPVAADPILEPGIESWDEAARQEGLLAKDASLTQPRRLLLAWYTSHYQDARSRQPRIRHILWTIRNRPDLHLLDSRSLRIDERDTGAFGEARKAWLEAMAVRGRDPFVPLRAAAALMRSDRETAARWLRNLLRRIEPDARREEEVPPPPTPGGQWWSWGFVKGDALRTLAQLYADAIVGVTARTPWEGTGPLDDAIARSSFALAARRELDASRDAQLLAETAWWLHLTCESFRRESRPPRDEFVPIAWAWLRRAESTGEAAWAVSGYMDPFQRYWSRLRPDLVPAAARRIQASPVKAVSTVPAVCPAGLNVGPAGVSVNVRLIIAADGRVRFAMFLGGPVGTMKPALKAVRQWRFAPTTQGPEPVEVETTIAVPMCTASR